MRISDWSSDVCSSDLHDDEVRVAVARGKIIYNPRSAAIAVTPGEQLLDRADAGPLLTRVRPETVGSWKTGRLIYANAALSQRSEEHTSELQSLMRISYAVFCLKKKKT